MGFFEKLKQGMSKTKTSFDEKINQVFTPFRKVDEELLEELEEALIMSDVGVETSTKIINNLRERVKKEKIKEEDERKKIQAESQTQSTYFKSNIVKEAKVQFALNKEEQKQKRKKQRRLEEIEKKIEDTEQIISACQAKLCDPEIFSDFEKSNIIQTTLNENEEKLQQLYEEWEALQR